MIASHLIAYTVAAALVTLALYFTRGHEGTHAVRGPGTDVDRGAFTGAAGHTWDLTLGWCDDEGRIWTWTGAAGPDGGPLMQCAGRSQDVPLDLVTAMFGPVRPVPAPAGDSR